MIDLDVTVISDRRREPWPGITINSSVSFSSVDNTALPPWIGMKRAMGEAFPTATHMLILEDDAACKGSNVFSQIELAIASRPSDPLYFWSSTEQAGDQIDAAMARGSAWAEVGDRCVGAVAVCLPMVFARRFVKWAESDSGIAMLYREAVGLESLRRAIGAGDSRLFLYLTEILGRPQVVSCLSLFEHSPPEGRSLVNPDREDVPKAHRLWDGVSEIDWSK